MRIFDSIPQELKFKVLTEVTKLAMENRLGDSYYAIPRIIVPSGEESMRCCIYKDRAIVEEMVRVVVGFHKYPNTLIDVLDIACDECPIDKYTVSEGCRGCIAHKCKEVCPVNAITISKTHKAVIDQEKCIECGKCFKNCPYSAIREQVRPCVKSCKINAIKVNQQRKAVIDKAKCVNCGACMVRCPFGAIQDKSYILETIDIIKGSEKGKNYKVYAIIAPAIVSQFRYAKIGQVVSGIKAMGVNDVIEVALGADIVAYKETKELIVKKKLLSSCCPSFVQYVENNFPMLKELISHNVSPMVETAKLIKKDDPNAKIIFIGPCISKKLEYKREEVAGIIDNVITFEELQALFHGMNIHIENLEESELNNGSYYGRIFARSGGLSDAVSHCLQELGSDFKLEGTVAEGLDLINIALLKMSKNIGTCNFIEGMACAGGCINGGGCVSHDTRNAKDVNDYGAQAHEKSVSASIKPYIDLDKI